MRTKVFQSGNSQAVRIPKAFRFDVDEVEIFDGDEVFLRARPKHLGEAFHLLASLPTTSCNCPERMKFNEAEFLLIVKIIHLNA